MTAGYSHTPLTGKLGIKAGSRVLIVTPPAGLDLGALPPGVSVHKRRGSGRYDVVLLFCPNARALRDRFESLIEALEPAGGLWVCWPKKASGVVTDVDSNSIREHGLACGVVDVKVAAIDATWGGLKFVRRLADR
jgi:hypothetical protein